MAASASAQTAAATQLLKGIGITPNPDNLRLASGWIQSEGGLVNGTNNPLNTTLNAPGALGAINGDGVKKFGSLDQGVAADASTLSEAPYAGIRSALQSGDQNAFINAVGSSPWGTSGSLLSKVLGSSSPAPAAAPAPAAPSPVKLPGGNTTAVPTTPATVQDYLAAIPDPSLLAQQQTAALQNTLGKGQNGYQAAQAMLDSQSQASLMTAAAQRAAATQNDAASVASKTQQAQNPTSPSTPTAEAAQGAPTAAGGPAKGAGAAVAWTQKNLGIPYSWGGGTPQGPTKGIAQGAGTVGYDCSAFTQAAWAHAGVQLPRDTYDQMKVGAPVANIQQAQPGDLLFPEPGHVMLYLGNGQAAEAPHTGGQTQNIPVSGMSFVSIRRPGA